MGRTFFRRANLIDGINAPRKNATVVVEGERITAVGTNGDAPKPTTQDTVYDLNGRSLMPGMVQCHYHVAYDNVATLIDLDLKHPPTYLTLIAARNAELLLKSGFTGAVGAGTLHNIDVTLKKAIRAGLVQGPRFLAGGRDIVTTGDSVDFHPSWWKLGMEGLGLICDGPDEFRKAVRDEIKQGVEIIKLYPTGGHGLSWPTDVMTMTQAELDAAADAAHERNAKIRGHICSKRGIMAALDAGIDVIDHADMMDEECIEGFVKQGTFVVPSLYFPYMMVEQKRRTGKAAFPGVDEMEKGLEQCYRVLPKAQAAGVKLVVGDDFGTAAMPHGDYAKELEAYVKGAGIPAIDVIQWATKNGAELLGMKDDLGTIEAGKLADLLVVNGDPSADITLLADRKNLHVVMQGGKFIECELSPSKVTAKAA
ncbi:MAG TPA: amidohydrolase family protein [Candidatus Binataceae bacterium]|nr:amidohydrolase family protein [Candidatus Binataceae bacterium]